MSETWQVVYDGSSRPIICTPDKRMLSLSQWENGKWVSYEREVKDADAYVAAMNADNTVCQHPPIDRRDMGRRSIWCRLCGAVSRDDGKWDPTTTEESYVWTRPDRIIADHELVAAQAQQIETLKRVDECLRQDILDLAEELFRTTPVSDEDYDNGNTPYQRLRALASLNPEPPTGGQE